MLVSFTYKNGRKVQMQKRFADILQKMKHGTYSESAGGPIELKKPAVSTPPPLEVKESVIETQEPAAPQGSEESEAKPLSVSVAAKKLAEEFKVALELLSGTGAGGQITKTDVENYIDSKI